LGATTSEGAELPGTGTMTATAQLGNTVDSTWNAIPFSNGNAVVTALKFRGQSVVPNLHAIASGSIDQPDAAGFGGQSVQASALVEFSDVVSISQAQANATLSENGLDTGVWVQLDYKLHGSATITPKTPVSGSGAEALGSFVIAASNPTDPSASQPAFDSGSFDEAVPLTTPDTLLGDTISIMFFLPVGAPELINAQLAVSGIATDSGYGPAASFNADLSDTAQFEGATFFADEAGTVPLPTLQLNSEFGFNYSPVTIVSDAGGVPEPSNWAMLLAGFAALGTVTRRTKSCRL
jgi:hypothetical protein